MDPLTVETLRAWREQKRDFRLIDVREKNEWDLVHITGSEWLPLSSFREQAPARLGRDETLALICHHGVRSHHAALFLEGLGYTRLFNVVGGIDAWAKCIDRTLPTY